MKVLVVGSGGREHAIVRGLLRDEAVTSVEAAPGNAGIAQDAVCHAVDAQDGQAVADLAAARGSDLVVIGPEAPLAAGVADAVRASGVPVFGPSAAAAELEASKAFAKDVMEAAGVPTAGAAHAVDEGEAAAALDRFGPPYVVKDDGLAAGKGVLVGENREEALEHARTCFAAGGSVVIEEFLDGPEVSLFVLSDGTNLVPLSPAQDFKRIADGDLGPNTGGMGAYTPLDWLQGYSETGEDGVVRDFVATVVDRVAAPTLQQMRDRGTPFVGVLYCGLAVTSRGVRVIEFNVRFGDPETQPVLQRLATPLGGLLMDCATGTLGADRRLEWSAGYAAGVVLAAANYPGSPQKGDRITGLEAAQALDGVAVLHAGTSAETLPVAGASGVDAGPDGGSGLGDDAGQGDDAGPGGDADQAEGARTAVVRTSGGRVLAVVGEGKTLGEAVERAYAGVDEISFAGMQYRTDIAAKALAGEIRLAPQLPGWVHASSGKVRDLYRPAPGSARAGQDVVLVVASDRISAFDHILASRIPGKGVILTQLSLWWFDRLAEAGVRTHVISTDVPAAVAGRAMICRDLDMIEAECIARGYLTGSGYAEYKASGTVTGIPLPEGLEDGSRLPEPIFTPSSKAELGGHDVNISFTELAGQVGQSRAEQLREATLTVYGLAEQVAREAGVILADTKLEFGVDRTSGELVLGDEVLTPDSSRFWPAESWAPGQSQPSFDKQFVRNWLLGDESGWDKGSGQAPPLPVDVAQATAERYRDAYQRITGQSIESQSIEL